MNAAPSAGEWLLVAFVVALYGALALALFAANHYRNNRSRRFWGRVRAWYARPGIDLDQLDGLRRPHRRGRS
jgi:hypothetical protein